MFRSEFTTHRKTHSQRAIYWCLAAAAAAALFAGLAYGLPVLEGHDRWLQEAPARQVVLWTGSALSLIAALAAILAHRWRTNVLGHESLQSIRRLSPREFNRLAEAGFRCQGYYVQSSERFFSRSGIDLILRKGGKHILVLCRRDQESARQMAAVHELHAATATLEGGSGLLITSETVALEVKAFAAEQGIAVIAGPALLKLVQRARGDTASVGIRREPHFGTPWADLPVCSECGSPMVADGGRGESDSVWYCSRSAHCFRTQPA